MPGCFLAINITISDNKALSDSVISKIPQEYHKDYDIDYIMEVINELNTLSKTKSNILT